jgi:hypothetical protein
MMTVNRKGNYQRDQTGAAEKRPQQKLPILESLLTKYTEPDA